MGCSAASVRRAHEKANAGPRGFGRARAGRGPCWYRVWLGYRNGSRRGGERRPYGLGRARAGRGRCWYRAGLVVGVGCGAAASAGPTGVVEPALDAGRRDIVLWLGYRGGLRRGGERRPYGECGRNPVMPRQERFDRSAIRIGVFRAGAQATSPPWGMALALPLPIRKKRFPGPEFPAGRLRFRTRPRRAGGGRSPSGGDPW